MKRAIILAALMCSCALKEGDDIYKINRVDYRSKSDEESTNMLNKTHSKPPIHLKFG